jgi:hypothetical protein
MIIDLMYSKAGKFTVDIASSSVPIVETSNPFMLGPNQEYFQPKDNIVLESIWCVMPCSFCTVNLPSPRRRLQSWYFWVDDLANSYWINQLGTSLGSAVGIPVENQEININSLINYPNIAGTKVTLNSELRGSVCMLNVPESLDEIEFDIYIYAKIRHTLKLIA